MEYTTVTQLIHPGIPGTNYWYSHRGQAYKAALRYATRMGPHYAVVVHKAHARGQHPHYHVSDPYGGNLPIHFFYGRKRPIKAPSGGRPVREFEDLFELGGDALDGELPNADPKLMFSVWAPAVIMRLNLEAPHSSSTKTITCFLSKLIQNWKGTNSLYINADRANRIARQNLVAFDSAGYTDSLKRDLLSAAKWSRDANEFYRRVIDLDYTVRNGLWQINRLYNLSGQISITVARMNSWGMAKQGRSNTILSCYR